MRYPLCAARLAVVSFLGCCPAAARAAADRDWSTYLGDKSGSHYSTLDQITPDNVAKLTVAWTWRAGDARGDSTQIQCNPLVIDGVIYATTPSLSLVALDAATGELRWRFDPLEPTGVNRGLAWWADGEDQRILFGAGKWLQAVDARTGALINSFGVGGRVDLSLAMGRDATGFAVQANTPGIVYGDLIVMGMRLGEGPAPAAPGPIRAYNVRTGRLAWVFNTIPHPGEAGHETWPAEAWNYVGGVNVWTGMTVDEKRGLLFCPTGSAAFDFWGGDRVGDNLYANCLLALRIETGELVWHYQFVHHDLWDRDLPAPPNLLTVQRDGWAIDAVAQVTKSGHVFVFNRETGEPLFPIAETMVPSSDLAGEVAALTQPLPLKPAPFARQVFTATEITDRTPEAHRAVLNRWARIRPHVPFQPPSEEGTIIFPGFDGGAEWGGAAVDPAGVLYVNANEMAWILSMIKTDGGQTLGAQTYLQNCAGCHGANRQGNGAGIPSLVDVAQRLNREQALQVVTQGRAMMPPWGFLPEVQRQAVVGFLLGQDEAAPRPTLAPEAAAATKQPGWETYVSDRSPVPHPAPPYTHTGYNRFLDPDGYPAVRPPWGTLNAIDLNTGEYLWRVPLGEYPELVAQGRAPTGTENYGGPVVTAGGLLFIGASKDEYFRAFDRRDGREVWRWKLPAGGYATPATYAVDGRQYVVIACGGGKMGTKSGDSYVAFALPAKE